MTYRIHAGLDRVCEDCGAIVAADATDVHDKQHATLKRIEALALASRTVTMAGPYTSTTSSAITFTVS